MNNDERYIEAINIVRERDFERAEQFFLEKFAKRVDARRRNIFNVCCNEQEKQMIKEFANKIKNIVEYSFVSLFDLYLTLIFAYYSLHLMEQTQDWLRTYDLDEGVIDSYTVNELYREITIGDLIDSEGNNLSSQIRRAFMGLRGGKRSRKKTKKSKSRKNKRNSRKNK